MIYVDDYGIEKDKAYYSITGYNGKVSYTQNEVVGW